MKTIYFLVEWHKDKKKTWSGTCWGLYSALQKYIKVKDIDIHESYFCRIVRKIFKIDSQLGLRNIILKRNNVKRHLRGDKNAIVFQFAEVIKDTENINTYLYIDVDVNYVKHLHDNELEIFNLSNFSSANLSSINIRNESQLAYLTNCRGVFTMGNWLKKSLIERLNISPERVHHVGGGVNLNITKIKDNIKENNKILFVGRDFERKGGFLVLEAFKILKNSKKDAELHIAGPATCPFDNNIDGVFYYGDCNHENIEELMNLCDIFCMPSYFEAYGLVFIEALAFGLPCIGRNAYEMPFFIENEKTGLLIDNDDPSDLASKMNTLLKDLSYKERVRSRRDWYISNYSWDSVANKIYNTIENDCLNK